MKAYIAEFLGTFALALTVGLSLAGKFPIATPIIAGLTLGICVYTFGDISGTHINPAITAGLLTIGKISIKDAVIYWVVQFAGGFAAFAVAGLLQGSSPHAGGADNMGIMAAEALGTFWLAIGVAAVVHGKASAAASGITIGGSLTIGIAMAAPLSNGVLNPAVALGIGSFSLSYAIAPIVGAIIAMQAYKFLASK